MRENGNTEFNSQDLEDLKLEAMESLEGLVPPTKDEQFCMLYFATKINNKKSSLSLDGGFVGNANALITTVASLVAQIAISTETTTTDVLEVISNMAADFVEREEVVERGSSRKVEGKNAPCVH